MIRISQYRYVILCFIINRILCIENVRIWNVKYNDMNERGKCSEDDKKGRGRIKEKKNTI